jgi:hypothetical protein
MDLFIALSQGLGLAVAAGFVAAPPVAFASTAAYLGFETGAIGIADDGIVVAIAWAAAIVEVLVDAVWPGAQAGARLARKAIGGGIAFELIAGDQLPWAGLAIGALVALAVAMALRHVRAGAVKAGGDLRGTAVIEDGAGIAGSAVGLIPVAGIIMAVGAAGLVLRARRHEQEKYKGLRVLR